MKKILPLFLLGVLLTRPTLAQVYDDTGAQATFVTDRPSTATLGALNAAVTVTVMGRLGVGFYLTTANLDATVVTEVTVDGTNWIATNFIKTDATTSATIVFTGGADTQIRGIIVPGGVNRARVRISSYTSGTSTGTLRATGGGGNVLLTPAGGGGGGGTSSNFGSSFPAAGTASGFSDGTNMQGARVFDLDTGAGTQYSLGVNLLKRASGGSVEAGTLSDPLRMDPTGTTTQPISGTVTANAGSGTFVVGDGTGPLTIDGTVTANAGTNLNTSALALDATLTGRFPAGASPADNESNTSAQSRVGAYNFVFDGSTWDRWTGAISGTVTANQGGTWNITNVSGTVSLPTGASTSANQTTEITALQKIDNIAHAGSDVALVEHVPNSAQFDDVSTTTVTENNAAPLRITSARALHVAQQGTVTVTGTVATTGGLTDAQLRATAVPVSGTVTANAGSGPWPVTDNAGSLTVDGTFWQATQPVSGTVTANAGTGTLTVGGGAAHDAAVTGNPNLIGGYASAAAPADVSADGDAVRAWHLRNGAYVANLAAGGTLITSTATSLNVNCTGGCTPGGSFNDSSAFTFGTTAVSNTSFVVDDVSTNAVAENSAGAARMSAGRILYVDLTRTTANTTAILTTGTGGTFPVTGTFWQGTQPVSGTFWQATQPVSAASLPLPTGAATSALQTQPGVDIGDVTVNNAAGASAVNVQDGGNSLTVDGTVTVGTFPDNEPFNLAQYGGSAVSTTNGVHTRGGITAQSTNTWDAGTPLNTTLTLTTTGYTAVYLETLCTGTVTGGQLTFSGNGGNVGDVMIGVHKYSAAFGAVGRLGTTTSVLATGCREHWQFNTAGYTSVSVILSTVLTGAGNVQLWLSAAMGDSPHAIADVVAYGGNNLSIGVGASGVGIPRVTVANDSSLASVTTVSTVSNVGTIGTSVTPGTGAGHLGKAEDAAHTSGDVGVMALGVMNTFDGSPIAFAVTDGDYAPIAVDGFGRVLTAIVGNTGGAVDSTGSSLNVSATGGNIATIGTSVTPGTAASNLGKGEDNAAVTGDTGVLLLGVRNQSATQLTNADFDYGAIANDAMGAVYVAPHPARFSCFVPLTTTITTQCQAAPAAGLRNYVTSITCSNGAATVQGVDVVYGTGANCVTGITAISHKHQMGTNGLTTSPFLIQASYPTPLVPTAATAVCFRPTAATAYGCTMTGFTAP